MAKKIKHNDNEIEIKKQLEELKAQLKQQTKKPKAKKATKIEKPKAKKATKIEKPKAKKATKIEKPKAKKAAKIKKEKAVKAAKIKKEKAVKAAKIKKEKAVKAAKIEKEKAAKIEKEKAEEEAKTPEEKLEEEFSDEQIRNFQIEKMDMDRITNKVCEIVAEYEDEGMLQSDLWKKLKLSSRDGSRLALRLERRGLISREKILQKDRWTYKLIIEQTPISLESLQNSPCLTCPVEQKCDIENAYPEPSPLHCQLIEDWVITEFTKKKK
jgi:DNA-binding MarR family transcriptional regulator